MFFADTFSLSTSLAPCEVIRNPESDLLLALESRIQGVESRIQGVEYGNQGVESGIQGVESGIQRPPGLPHIGRLPPVIYYRSVVATHS